MPRTQNYLLQGWQIPHQCVICSTRSEHCTGIPRTNFKHELTVPAYTNIHPWFHGVSRKKNDINSCWRLFFPYGWALHLAIFGWLLLGPAPKSQIATKHLVYLLSVSPGNFSLFLIIYNWYYLCTVHHGHRIRRHKNRVFHFDMSEVDPEEILTAAELRLYKRSEDVTNTTLTLNIFTVKPGYNDG